MGINGFGGLFSWSLGYVIIRVQVEVVRGHNEDQVALVIPDSTAFASWVPVTVGTPAINCIINMIKESEIDELSVSLNGSRICHLLTCCWAELSIRSEMDMNQTMDPTNLKEVVKMIKIKKEKIEVFSSKIIHTQNLTSAPITIAKDIKVTQVVSSKLRCQLSTGRKSSSSNYSYQVWMAGLTKIKLLPESYYLIITTSFPLNLESWVVLTWQSMRSVSLMTRLSRRGSRKVSHLCWMRSMHIGRKCWKQALSVQARFCVLMLVCKKDICSFCINFHKLNARLLSASMNTRSHWELVGAGYFSC